MRCRPRSSVHLLALTMAAAAVLAFSAPAVAEDKRDAEIRPDRVMDLLGIGPGMVIGEPGAGRGYFTLKLARRVGDTGKVYANDIDTRALDELRERCREQGLSNVETIVGRVNDPLFPKGTLDLVMMVYAIHDFAEPQAFLEALKPSLKPGARVVILDRDPEKTGENHFLTRERLLALFRESGYAPALDERSVDKHVLLVFRVAAAS